MDLVGRAPIICLAFLFLSGGLCIGCGPKNRPIVSMDPVEEEPILLDTTPDEAGVGNLASPSLEVDIEPSAILRGESADLSWTSLDAESVSILPDIGDVGLSGTLRVFPDETTRYLVRATGSGGSFEKVVEVTVSADSAGISSENLSPRTLGERFLQEVRPVFFAFDSWELSAGAKATLDANVAWLRRFENSRLQVLIEGHCDARGTEEYNLALGDRRARMVEEYMLAEGLARNRLRTLSLGEERPFVLGDSEEAYAGNRRANFVLIDSQ